jgi:hypothetical protein
VDFNGVQVTEEWAGPTKGCYITQEECSRLAVEQFQSTPIICDVLVYVVCTEVLLVKTIITADILLPAIVVDPLHLVDTTIAIAIPAIKVVIIVDLLGTTIVIGMEVEEVVIAEEVVVAGVVHHLPATTVVA